MLWEQSRLGVAQMKRKWDLKRQFVEQDDGQRRWDKAYQLLMQMTAVPKEDTATFQSEVVAEEKSPGAFL
jgi:hypothetical protein